MKTALVLIAVVSALVAGPGAVPRNGRIVHPFGATAVNRLSAILSADDVLVGVEADGMQALFRQVGSLFERQHGIAATSVVDNLMARERLGSTGLGRGVAIPHGRIKGLKEPLAAVLCMRRPIPFYAPDDEPVFLFVFLLVPQSATPSHLEMLAEIAEMLADREFRERLQACGDAAGVHRAIAERS